MRTLILMLYQVTDALRRPGSQPFCSTSSTCTFSKLALNGIFYRGPDQKCEELQPLQQLSWASCAAGSRGSVGHL